MSNEEERPQVEPVDLPEAEQAEGWPPSRGLALHVLRPEGRDGSNGGISYLSNRLTLVGVVKFENEQLSDRYQPDEIPEQEPSIAPLPTDCQKVTVAEYGSPVLLMINRHGGGEQYLIPADPETYEPVFLTLEGGNYAVGSDPEFAVLVGHKYAIPVRDRRPSVSDRNRWRMGE